LMPRAVAWNRFATAVTVPPHAAIMVQALSASAMPPATLELTATAVATDSLATADTLLKTAAMYVHAFNDAAM
jgi:hypothetical protein